jgi:hypothetical protein
MTADIPTPGDLRIIAHALLEDGQTSRGAIIYNAADRMATLLETLRPFAKEGREWSGENNIAGNTDIPFIKHQKDDEDSETLFTVGDLRRAARIFYEE